MTADFYAGAAASLSAVVAMFFVRYWRMTHDRLFGFFAAAFAIFAAHWVILGLADVADETRHLYYVPRAVAFLCILAGVIDKRRAGP